MSKRCLIYVRVSSGRQESEGTSLESQEMQARTYATREGWTVIGIVTETKSAENWTDRDGVHECIRRAKASEFDVLLTHALDRFTRDEDDLHVLRFLFREYGVRLDFSTESYPDSPLGDLMMTARATFAKIERLSLIERTQRGRQERIKKGLPLYSRVAPYGYQWAVSDQVQRGKQIKTGYVLDDEPRPGEELSPAGVMRRIYTEYVAGRTLRAIAAGLTADGYTTASGKAGWHLTRVRELMRNPIYMGEIHVLRYQQVKSKDDFGRKRVRLIERPEGPVNIVRDAAPAIVESAIWYAAQAQMRLNQQHASRNASRPHDYLLRGCYAKCGHCGRSLTARKSSAKSHTDKDGNGYYRCNGTNMRVLCSAGPSYNQTELDAPVWAFVRRILADPSIVQRELQRLVVDDPTTIELAALERAIKEAENMRRGLAGQLAAFIDPETGEIDEEIAAPIRQQLTIIGDGLKSKRARHAEVVARQAAWRAARERLLDVEKLCRAIDAELGESPDYDLKRRALDALGITVTVWRRGTHTHNWQIETGISLDGIDLGAFERVADNPESPRGGIFVLVSATKYQHKYGGSAVIRLVWTDLDAALAA